MQLRTDEGLAIGAVAEATGMSVHALRYFEREHLLLRPVARSGGQRRMYDTSDVEWLLLCTRLRASGMSIATLRRFAELVRAGPGNERQRLSLLQEHEGVVCANIAALQENLTIIHEKVAAYEQHVRDGTAAGVWEPNGGQ
jgi:DNA-binding transcriptional MerR regulator